MNAEQLRTRLAIAAQKFATEIADVVLEAAGDQERAKPLESEKRARRRPSIARAPAPAVPLDPVAVERAAVALDKLGIRRKRKDEQT